MEQTKGSDLLVCAGWRPPSLIKIGISFGERHNRGDRNTLIPLLQMHSGVLRYFNETYRNSRTSRDLFGPCDESIHGCISATIRSALL